MSIAEPVALAQPPIRAARQAQLLIDLIGYGACSAAALALDYGLLLMLAYRVGLHYLIASAIAFTSGLLLAYLLSISFVFKGRRSLRASQEFIGFASIGIGGLILTQMLLLGLVGGLGLPLPVAKPLTAMLVFLFNFGMRRSLLFSSDAAHSQLAER